MSQADQEGRAEMVDATGVRGRHKQHSAGSLHVADDACDDEEANWESLPAELLGIVMSNLGAVSDRANLRLVCRPWARAFDLTASSLNLSLMVPSDFPQRFHYIKKARLSDPLLAVGRDYMSAEQHPVMSVILRRVANSLQQLPECEHLIALDLTGLSLLGPHMAELPAAPGDQHALSVLSRLTRLQELILPHKLEEGLSWDLTCCSRLQALTKLVTHNIDLSATGLAAAMCSCTKLVDFRGVLRDEGSVRPMLEHYAVHGQPPFGLRSMEILRVGRVVSQRALAAFLASQAATLQTLQLALVRYPAVSAEFVGALAKLTGLTTLDVNGMNVRGSGVDHPRLAELAALRQLRQLELSGLTGADSKLVAMLSRQPGLQDLSLHLTLPATNRVGLLGTSLTRLEIGHQEGGARLSPSHLAVLQSLRWLGLKGCPWVDDRWLMTCPVLTRLHTLNLLQCPASGTGFSSWASACSSLRDVSLGTAVTESGLDSLVAACPSLVRLRLLGCSRLGALHGVGAASRLQLLQLLQCASLTEAAATAIAALTQLTRLELRSLWFRPQMWALDALLELPRLQEARVVGGEVRRAGGYDLPPGPVMSLPCCFRASRRRHPAPCMASQLCRLDLAGCAGLADSHLPQLAALGGSLRSLDVSGAHLLVGWGLSSLTRLSRLTSLNLSFCPRLSDQGIAALAGVRLKPGKGTSPSWRWQGASWCGERRQWERQGQQSLLGNVLSYMRAGLPLLLLLPTSWMRALLASIALSCARAPESSVDSDSDEEPREGNGDGVRCVPPLPCCRCGPAHEAAPHARRQRAGSARAQAPVPLPSAVSSSSSSDSSQHSSTSAMPPSELQDLLQPSPAPVSPTAAPAAATGGGSGGGASSSSSSSSLAVLAARLPSNSDGGNASPSSSSSGTSSPLLPPPPAATKPGLPAGSMPRRGRAQSLSHGGAPVVCDSAHASPTDTGPSPLLQRRESGSEAGLWPDDDPAVPPSTAAATPSSPIQASGEPVARPSLRRSRSGRPRRPEPLPMLSQLSVGLAGGQACATTPGGLAPLARLTSLQLLNADGRAVSPPVLTRWSCGLRQLQELSVNDCAGLTAAALQQLTQDMPSLLLLHARGVRLNRAAADGSSSASSNGSQPHVLVLDASEAA